MGGFENIDAWGVVKPTLATPETRLGRQTVLKERQFTLKWVGRSSSKRDGVEILDSSPKRQSSTKADTGQQQVYQRRNSPSVKQKERLRTKPQLSRQLRSDSVLRINAQSSADLKGEEGAQVHELFKKEFIEKLAEKAKQRSGYLVSSNDLAEPVKNEPKLLKETEPVDLVNTFIGSPKRDSLKGAVIAVKSARTIPRSCSYVKKRSSPVHEKFSEISWMSKCEKLNSNHPKQPWSSSKTVEENSKDFLLTKFFQTPTKAAAPAYEYEIYAAESNEEMSPTVYSSAKHILSSKHNAAQKINDVQQQLLIDEELQNSVHMTAERTRSRGALGFDGGNKLVDYSSQIRRDGFDSPSRSLGGRFLSTESEKDSRNTSTRSVGRRSGAEALSSRDHKPNSSTSSLNKSQVRKVTQSEPPKMQPSVKLNKGDEYGNESQLVPREKENMLRSLKMASAVDQAHFLRALQDNGAVQSTTPIKIDFERPAHCDGNDSLLPRSPSPNGTRTNNILREARSNYEVDVRGDLETRSREATLADQREASIAASDSTNSARAVSLRRRRSIDGSPEKSPLHSGHREVHRNSNGNELPQSGNLLRLTSVSSTPSCHSPRLSGETSHRSSIVSTESESSSGSSIIQMLMRKASLRSSLSMPANQTILAQDSSTVPVRENSLSLAPRSPSSASKTDLRRTLTFRLADSSTDVVKKNPESQRRSAVSSTKGHLGWRSSKPKVSEDLSVSELLSESNSQPIRVKPVFGQSDAPASTAAFAEQHLFNNSFRVNGHCVCHARASIFTELESRRATSPSIPDPKNSIKKTVEESCSPIATPERAPLSTVLSGGSPWSPGSDDSGSEASGIEQPSPVSVLLYNNDRTHFRENSRLSPLEHKLQELHERIHKSKTEVSNQKKANLEKIKARELELRRSAVPQLEIPGPLLVEDPRATCDQIPVLVSALASANFEKKELAIIVAPVARDEKVGKVGPRLDFCTTLEIFDLQSIPSWTEEQKWDLVYVRDVLVASSFGRQKRTMTKWHSVAQPMNPRLFEDLEDFYKNGKNFSGSQFLRSLAVSQEDHLRMQKQIQSVHSSPTCNDRGTIDSLNRCHLFDVVNETLARKLVPYVALPRPWMKSLAKPVVRPRPTGSGLLQEVWAEICDQIGNTGSLAMDKAQLQQSLEDLSSTDLYKRSHLFPSREVERAAERIGLELERRIFEDLIEETIIGLRNSI